MPGDEVLAVGSDKELVHVVIGHARHDNAPENDLRVLRYVRKLTSADIERLARTNRNKTLPSRCKEQIQGRGTAHPLGQLRVVFFRQTVRLLLHRGHPGGLQGPRIYVKGAQGQGPDVADWVAR